MVQGGLNAGMHPHTRTDACFMLIKVKDGLILLLTQRTIWPLFPESERSKGLKWIYQSVLSILLCCYLNFNAPFMRFLSEYILYLSSFFIDRFLYSVARFPITVSFRAQ